MPAGTQLPEGYLGAPATTGQVLLVKADLNAKIDRVAYDLSTKIDEVRTDLEIKIRDVRLSMNRSIWLAVATLSAVGIVLRYF